MQTKPETNRFKENSKENIIDTFSFQLGMINCFIEMVACGVKRLALSPPLTKKEFQAVKPLSDRLVKEFNIFSYRETSLIKTHLQSDSFTKNKSVILYYKSEHVLEQYISLKEKTERLIREDTYNPDEKISVTREFLTLLSYPDDVIHEKLVHPHKDPFIITD